MVTRTTSVCIPKRKAEELAPAACFSQDTSAPPRLSRAEQEMVQRTLQAARDHNVDPSTLPPIKAKRILDPMHTFVRVSSRKGIRPSNDDAHVHKHLPFGPLLAICDGHGDFDPLKRLHGMKQIGQEAADLVAESIENDLPRLINERNFNTAEAFKEWCSAMQAKMPDVRAGTTAAIAFLEKINLRLHVATIGDSEVVVFRHNGNYIEAIPLSVIINWSSPACVEKVRKLLPPEEFAEWEKLPAKHRRWPPIRGVNIANTLGDKTMLHEGQEALTHRPECSLFQLEEGDLVVIGCDGVFDFAKLEELASLITHDWDTANFDFAGLITDFALRNKRSTDNVSAVTCKIVPRSAKDLKEPSVGFPSPTSPLTFVLPDDHDSSPPTPNSNRSTTDNNNPLHRWIVPNDSSSDDEVDSTPPMEGVVKDAFE
jgi:serine/threonine protein phosphatase PrpC